MTTQTKKAASNSLAGRAAMPLRVLYRAFRHLAGNSHHARHALAAAKEASAAKDWPRAINRWKAVLDLLGEEAPVNAYVHLSKAYRQKGDFEAAARAIKDGSLKSPESLPVKLEAAWLATVRQDWPEAVAAWRTVRDALGEPASAECYVELSRACRGVGDFDAAETAIEQGRRHYPHDVTLAPEYAHIADGRQDWAQAMTRWQAVVDAGSLGVETTSLARMHLSIARRLMAVRSFQSQIEEYVNSRNQTPTKPRIAIYTAICGGYDTIKLPDFLNLEHDYLVFTDRRIADTGIFEVRPFTYFGADPTRTARFVKTHPHLLLGGYDIAIWIDANIMIVGDISPMVETFLRSGKAVGAVPHPHRRMLAEELQACIERSKDERREMDKQVAHYLALGAQCSDLIESNLMMFNLWDPRTSPFLDRWWTEIDRHSRRDQLSLNYALTQSGIEWHPLIERPNCVRTHPAFALAPHDTGSGPPAALVEALGRPPIDPYAGEAYANVREERIAAQQGRAIDVVVCVHNALEDVRRCMETLRRNRRSGQRLILIDDGSDAPTAQYLEDLARDAAWIALHRNERPTGYTHAANRGLAAADSEFVILLNSDTEVTDGWAEKLADAVFSTPGAGIVGPMSSAASHQSVPEHRGAKGQTAINELPPGLTVEDMNRYCERWSVVGILPRVPLVHGFCFGVTREVIDKIGLFDADSFPKGYGEENDYCFRAADAGFGLVIATHSYVFHAKSKSYSDELRVPLMQAGSAAFRQRYGRARVERAIKSVEENPMLEALRENARSLYRDRFAVSQRPE